MTGILALACFMTGSVVAWLLRTGYVTTQLSRVQEQMEHKVRYWQSEAIYARTQAEDAFYQLLAITGRAPGPAACPGPEVGWARPKAGWQRPETD